MNRKQKRELRKDKNLVKELYMIIVKYLPNLLIMFSELTDVRDKRYITYFMKTICVTRLFGLLCGLTTMTEITDKFNTDFAIDNLSNICSQNLRELPYWQTIQDVFVNLKIDEIKKIQKYIVITLIRSKMFDKYRHNGYIQIIVDGTGLSHHDYNLNDNCIIKKSKDGIITYYKYVLECKLVFGNIVISLDTEFIENNSSLTDKQKQDCEINAFKRMAKRIKKNYPKYKFIVTGDALYACEPMINICEHYNWLYIFNLKPDRLKYINDCFEGNILLNNETNYKNYFLSTNIEYKKHKINVIKYIEDSKTRVTTFRYVTNFKVNDYNIKDIVKLGRKRWKIENEGFYTQKHGTFNITHLSSRNDNAMKIHYYFIQIAHVIRQLLEQGNLLVKSLKLKIKEVSVFILSSLTSTNSSLNYINVNFQLRFDD